MGDRVTDLEHIFQDQTTVFKLNLSFGFVLFNNETEQMQYHHSSTNNKRVFETPFLVRSREDLQCLNGLANNVPTPNGLWWILRMLRFT